MPHGHCYLWKPALVSAHVGSDLLIGLAYISISLILYALAKRIKLQFSAVVLCFGVFIGACGLTHFMEIWTLWQPDYWASAWIKGVTAVASVGTGVYLYRLRSPIVNVVEALRTAEARRIKLEESTFDLVDRENTLRSFFEAAPMMLGIADLENDDIRHVSDNPTAVEFFGRSADETKGRLASELGVPPASIQLWVEHYRRAEETNAPVRFEYSHETPNGDRVLAVVVSLIGKSPHGYSRFSYIVQDITEQRKAEADLRDSKTRLERLVAVRTSELRSAESRFKSTFDRAAIGIVHTDLKGRFMMVNPKMCEITGYSEDELLTKSFDDITHPDDHELNWKGVEALVNGELSTFEYEKRYLRKNGSVIWVKVSAAVSRDFDGKPEYFITCIDDITEKKRVKEEHDRLFALPNHLLCILDEKAVFKEVNNGFTNVLGYAREELIGHPIWDFVHPDDFQRSIEAEYRGKSMVIRAFENRWRDKTGQYHWLRWTGTIVDGINYGAAIDVTELKELEQNLKESELRFRTLANSIPQLAWITDSTGAIIWYNQRWYDYTGTTLEQMQGWGWKAVHHPDHTERVTKKWLKHLESGEFWEDTFPLRSQEGTYHWFLSRASAVRDETGRIIQWFGTNTDITDQMRFERELIESKDAAEKANQAKSQFLANMSHEIRTPIGVIMGFSELLRNAALTENERSNYTAIIDRNSNQLLSLIDDVLDLAKVEAGKLSIEIIPFSLVELLADFDSMMNMKAKEKGIEFKLRIDGLIPEQVCTDPTRLKQILTNVAGNAIKFTERGQVELVVRYAKPELILNVNDSGIGITPKQAERLFQPFGQADPSLTRRFGGTGLGLVLSRRLANALGGDLVLKHSEPGVGSTFEARIKPKVVAGARMVDQSGLTHQATPAALLDPHKLRLSGMRVLVVEDSLDNRTLVIHYLRNTGAEVMTAEDGVEGVKKCLSETPDAVLMDIQMPRLDGHAATKELRALGFSRPIIAVTAHAMKEERDRCFDSGCNEYLTKPLRRDQLIDVLMRFWPVVK